MWSPREGPHNNAKELKDHYKSPQVDCETYRMAAISKHYLVPLGLNSFDVVRQLTDPHLKHSTLTQRRLQLQLQSRYLHGNHRLILPTTTHRSVSSKSTKKLQSNDIK